MKQHRRGVAIAAVAACAGPMVASGETVRLDIDGDAFEIPEHYLVTQRPFWLKYIPGLLPDPDGASLVVRAADMAARVPGYRTHDGDVEATIWFTLEKPGSEKLAAYLDPEMHVYSDVWYGREYLGGGRYRETPDAWEVEPYGNSGLYKVRRRGPRSSTGIDFWTAVRIPPRSLERIPENPFDFYVGACSTRPSAPRMESSLRDSCRTRIISGDWVIGFGVDGMNLHLIGEINVALL